MDSRVRKTLDLPRSQSKAASPKLPVAGIRLRCLLVRGHRRSTSIAARSKHSPDGLAWSKALALALVLHGSGLCPAALADSAALMSETDGKGFVQLERDRIEAILVNKFSDRIRSLEEDDIAELLDEVLMSKGTKTTAADMLDEVYRKAGAALPLEEQAPSVSKPTKKAKPIALPGEKPQVSEGVEAATPSASKSTKEAKPIVLPWEKPPVSEGVESATPSVSKPTKEAKTITLPWEKPPVSDGVENAPSTSQPLPRESAQIFKEGDPASNITPPLPLTPVESGKGDSARDGAPSLAKDKPTSQEGKGESGRDGAPSLTKNKPNPEEATPGGPQPQLEDMELGTSSLEEDQTRSFMERMGVPTGIPLRTGEDAASSSSSSNNTAIITRPPSSPSSGPSIPFLPQLMEKMNLDVDLGLPGLPPELSSRAMELVQELPSLPPELATRVQEAGEVVESGLGAVRDSLSDVVSVLAERLEGASEGDTTSAASREKGNQAVLAVVVALLLGGLMLAVPEDGEVVEEEESKAVQEPSQVKPSQINAMPVKPSQSTAVQEPSQRNAMLVKPSQSSAVQEPSQKNVVQEQSRSKANPQGSMDSSEADAEGTPATAIQELLNTVTTWFKSLGQGEATAPLDADAGSSSQATLSETSAPATANSSGEADQASPLKRNPKRRNILDNGPIQEIPPGVGGSSGESLYGMPPPGSMIQIPKGMKLPQPISSPGGMQQPGMVVLQAGPPPSSTGNGVLWSRKSTPRGGNQAGMQLPPSAPSQLPMGPSQPPSGPAQPPMQSPQRPAPQQVLWERRPKSDAPLRGGNPTRNSFPTTGANPTAAIPTAANPNRTPSPYSNSNPTAANPNSTPPYYSNSNPTAANPNPTPSPHSNSNTPSGYPYPPSEYGPPYRGPAPRSAPQSPPASQGPPNAAYPAYRNGSAPPGPPPTHRGPQGLGNGNGANGTRTAKSSTPQDPWLTSNDSNDSQDQANFAPSQANFNPQLSELDVVNLAAGNQGQGPIESPWDSP